MHYNDPNHLKVAKLQIVIYKHMDLTVSHTKDLFDYQICSIYKCQHIDMFMLQELWDDLDKMFPKQLNKLKPELFYLVDLTLGKKGLKWESSVEITNAMFKKNPALGLH
jgi:hypothetical protein